MNQLISDFLVDIDRAWRLAPGPPVALSVKRELLELAGRLSSLHRKWSLYVEIVGNGLPFLPQAPRWNSLPELDARLRHFRIRVLDVVDVVVSKLARFEANDQADIDAMVERGLVPHDALIERFRSAVYMFELDARAPDLPKYVANLHRVERDMLDVDETEIDLPSWI